MAMNGVNGFHHDDVAEKKELVTERLQKREDERQADLIKRREEKENIMGVNETLQYFSDTFNKEKDAIENALATCKSSDKTVMRERFDVVSQSYQKLHKFAADSTLFLTAYEVSRSQDVLTKLQAQIQEKRDELLPKKKFAFSSRKKIDKTLQPVITNGAHNVIDKKANLEIELAAYKISNLQGVTQTKGDADIGKKDVVLNNLNDSTIKLLGAPSTVHMKNLKNCTVLCGPVSSSVFISDCQDCVFVLACQQLRTHTTTDSSVYLHVTSRAIIEDCKGLLFAPYNLSYVGLNEHFDRSGLDINRNNWNDVDDFNWLASDAHSPNWAIMKEVDRKTFDEK